MLEIHQGECSVLLADELLKCQKGRCVSYGVNCSLSHIPAVDGDQMNNEDVPQICIILPDFQIQNFEYDRDTIQREEAVNELLPKLLEITQSQVIGVNNNLKMWKLKKKRLETK